MKIEIVEIKTAFLSATDIRIALQEYAKLPIGSVVLIKTDTTGQPESATVSHSKPVE